MKIELEFPYTQDWDKGYLNFSRREGRWYVSLVSESKRSGTSYSRYLMSVHLGRYLEKDEHVDHIDEDKTNDVIDNLQILTHKENCIKHIKESGKSAKYITLICPSCKNEFETSIRNYKARKKNNKHQYCSRICSGRGSVKDGSPVSKEHMSEEIKRLRNEKGLSSYKISERLGISRNTVMKYWN